MKRLPISVLLFTPFLASSVISDEMNLATCLLGGYSDICNHDLLTKEQAKKVERAELEAKYKVNLEICSRQFNSVECEGDTLTDDDYIKIEKKYSSIPRNHQNGPSNNSLDESLRTARLEEASKAAYARKTAGTKTKYANYTLDFGRGNHNGTVMSGGRSIDNPNRTLDGRDKRLVTADRNRERAYDKATRNTRGTSVQSARIRADLEYEKISGMSSEYDDRDRKREYDKAIRNNRGTSAHSADIRKKLELAKQGVDVSNYQYSKIRPAPVPAHPIPSTSGGVYIPIGPDGNQYIAPNGGGICNKEGHNLNCGGIVKPANGVVVEPHR